MQNALLYLKTEYSKVEQSQAHLDFITVPNDYTVYKDVTILELKGKIQKDKHDWFAISARWAFICLFPSGMWFLNATVFQLSWQFGRLVAMVGVMKGFPLPLLPMLTVSSGFAVMPGWLSLIAFIVNDGDAGRWGFLQSRQLAAMVTDVMGVGAM